MALPTVLVPGPTSGARLLAVRLQEAGHPGPQCSVPGFPIRCALSPLRSPRPSLQESVSSFHSRGFGHVATSSPRTEATEPTLEFTVHSTYLDSGESMNEMNGYSKRVGGFTSLLSLF